MDYAVHGILQARILEWVAFSFSRGSSQPRDRTQVTRIADGFFIPTELKRKPKNIGVGSLSLLQQIFLAQGLNQSHPALQADSLPQGKGIPLWLKPKNAGVGSLSLLQRIFPTQESNQGLLHCRWILYQLSCQGIPPTYSAAAKSLQLCPTLCDPIDSSPPGSPVPGILQARTLEWVAISLSNAGK